MFKRNLSLTTCQVERRAAGGGATATASRACQWLHAAAACTGMLRTVLSAPLDSATRMIASWNPAGAAAALGHWHWHSVTVTPSRGRLSAGCYLYSGWPGRLWLPLDVGTLRSWRLAQCSPGDSESSGANSVNFVEGPSGALANRSRSESFDRDDSKSGS